MVDFEYAQPSEDYSEARAMTIHNLKFIGWAMHNFTKRNGGRLPPAATHKNGKPVLSWRVAILPWLEEFALYQRFHLDEPWDSSHNKALLKEMPRVYAPVTHKETTPYVTYYQGIVGPGSLFDGQEGTKIEEVIDAQNPTLMVAEAARPDPGPSLKTRRMTMQGHCRSWEASSRMASTLVSPTVPCGSSAGRSHPKGSAHSSRSGDGNVLSSDCNGSAWKESVYKK